MKFTTFQSLFSPAVKTFTISACALVGVIAHANPNISAHYDNNDELVLSVSRAGVINHAIAIAPFVGDGALSSALAKTLNGELHATASGLPVPNATSQSVSQSLTTWQQAGFRYVLTGSAHSLAGAKRALRYELIDVETGKTVLSGDEFMDSTPQAKETAAAKISERIHQAITGKAGDFTGQIAYVAEQGRGAQKTSSLILATPNGTTLRTLTQVQGSIFSPTFSPDGTRIAYSVQRTDGLPVIYVQRTDGSTPELATPFKGNNLGASFSPDGTKLLFSGSHENHNPNIYELDLIARTLTRRTNLAGAENSPSYLPDGSGFIFSADNGSRTPKLYRYRFSDGKIAPLGLTGTNPKPSQDGTRLTYVQGGRVMLANLNGANAQSVGTAGTDTLASFSPSGQRLLYATGSTLTIASPDGKKRQIRLNATTVRDPAWR
ncbi:hypothetical protein B0181_05440 [Moraxella caviae]|uniref:Translocation protein TolB n=1 Tax=Moraxella caviae TaxID=34060 RepID=A0A1T0A3F7_9GAMM|nr:PD40 domain-containing protein [Moraxella caviae]OOR90089.1 hypothetical protein B0181_05440 [Moraxella caviae]STZ14707.1 translocation protein TolB [Moraxella caviae]VEW11424.1 translocation protein TolB [Moraxella caviae]